MVNEIETLREKLEHLTARVEALELDERVPNEMQHEAAQTDDGFWALSALQARLPNVPSTVDGAITLVGSLTLPSGAPVAWQQTVGSAGLLELDWESRAAPLAALAHPVRLELLRQMLCGVHATAELASIESLGTTGQLHHHLRQLVAAGWVRQSSRGSYEVPPARIVPLLGCLMGAEG